MYQAGNRIFLHIVSRHRKVRLQGIALPLYLYPVESRIQYLMGQDMLHPLQISRNIQPARSANSRRKASVVCNSAKSIALSVSISGNS